MPTPATAPAEVSNNPCQESLSAWLLSRRFFDNPHSVGLLTSPALRPHRRLRMYCHFFLPEKVVHTIADGALYRFEPFMGVTNFRLIRAPLRYRMPRTHTNSLRLPHTAEPILTEPHCRPRP